MKIFKVYNNNVVSYLNNRKEEVLLTGAGLGYMKKRDDNADKSWVIQKFILENDKRKRMSQLVQRFPKEFFWIK